MFFNQLHRFNISAARIKWRWNREFHRKVVCHLVIPIPFHILRNYSTFSNIKENKPLVVISDYQDDAAIPEDIVIDSKNYYYLGNIKAWIQSGGKIEYPKNINYQVILNWCISPKWRITDYSIKIGGKKFSYQISFRPCMTASWVIFQLFL